MKSAGMYLAPLTAAMDGSCRVVTRTREESGDKATRSFSILLLKPGILASPPNSRTLAYIRLSIASSPFDADVMHAEISSDKPRASRPTRKNTTESVTSRIVESEGGLTYLVRME